MDINDKRLGRKEIHLSLSPRDGAVYDFFENLYAPSKSAVVKKMIMYCLETGGLATLLPEERDLLTGKVVRQKLGILSKEFAEKYGNYFSKGDMVALFGEVVEPKANAEVKDYKNHASQVYKQSYEPKREPIVQPTVKQQEPIKEELKIAHTPVQAEPTRVSPSTVSFASSDDNKGDKTVISVNKPANGSSGYDY